MANPILALIVPLGDGGLGIWGGAAPPYPSQGLPGNQPYPDQGLPGGQGGRPSQPIYHPGHPSHGLPAHPDQGLPGLPPGVPTHPIELPQPLPPPPAEYADKWVAAIWNPQTDTWKVSVGEATPTPHG